MCKTSPGKRCSSHVLEKIGNLESKVDTLDESIKKLDFKLNHNRAKDSNYDETEEGQLIVQERLAQYETLKNISEQLHEERASFYITNAGQEHLQEVIDDPNSTAKEVMNALINHNTAVMRKDLDKQVMEIVKNDDIPLNERYELVTKKIDDIGEEINNIVNRETVINENITKAEAKVESFTAKGMHKEAGEWKKTVQLYKNELRYLESYRNQLASFASNVSKWQERTLKDLDTKAEKIVNVAFDNIEKAVKYAGELW